jgi:6-pyruvoyltetrahydropterin/6-carboxytetrahydropterin synthase
MQRSLVEKIAPRLKQLDKGGYSRVYRKGPRLFQSSLSLAIGEIMDALGVAYSQGEPIPGTGLKADFKVGAVYLLVEPQLAEKELGTLRRTGLNCVIVRNSSRRSDGFDKGIRVISMEQKEGGELETIFLDDPSFNFDYAHILPHTAKCSVMHGHTSSALVEVVGRTVDGMVVDFGVVKELVREAVRGLDHKLFISSKYVTSQDGRQVSLAFKTVHGDFAITAPKATTVLLEGEATVENLADELLRRIAPSMPPNVTAVGVYVYEGLNKGAHVVAQVHARGVEPRRRKR